MTRNILRTLLPALLLVLSGTWACAQSGNALDRIDFGSAVSEAAHGFDPDGGTPPPSGTGAFGQPYRQPYGGGSPLTSQAELVFTLKCSPTRQTYLTVKLWGDDTQGEWLFLKGAEGPYGAIDSNGGPPPFPGRFHYETVPIPVAWTQGKGSVQLTLYSGNSAQNRPVRPIYSAFSHVEPRFAPASADATGSKPAQDGFRRPVTLSAAQVVGLLQANRRNIYGSGGYYDNLLAHQIPAGTPGAPPEVIGLHLNNSVADESAHATPEQWRNDAYNSAGGPGYSKFPDELVSALVSTYFLPPFKGAAGSTVAGLDHFHDAGIIGRIVSALDGCTYLQVGDGGFGQNYNEWQGLTSKPRESASLWHGTTARASGWSNSLEGVDSETLGYAIIRLLNDPTAVPLFQSYLSGGYDADFTGTPLLRATAYERMLSNHINYLYGNTGGTQSQNLFQQLGMYACQIALGKLQALYPNGAYPGAGPAKAVTRMEMVLGLVPEAGMGGTDPAYYNSVGMTNYGLTPGGFGEAHGSLSSGYDGRYGTILPWLAPRFAQLAAWDAHVDEATLRRVRAEARATLDGFDWFISPGENAGFGTSGADLGRSYNHFTLAQEDFITYRDPYNPNANGGSFEVNSQYLLSDPQGPLRDPDALRSAYLQALYGLTPGTGAGGHASVEYLKDLAAYESTLRGLIGVNPATLAALPGEPGRPNGAFVDPQSGATAVYCNGERLYMNANWRTFENHGNSFRDVSDFARIHDTTGTLDWAAIVEMPHDPATVQSDGNLSGGQRQGWVVRYGPYLMAGNDSAAPMTIRLPPGDGVTREMVGHKSYRLGSSMTLPPGVGAVFALPGAGSAGNGTAPLLADGYYTLTSRAGGLPVDNKDNADGPVALAAATGGLGQKWLLTSLGNGTVRLTNAFSVLAVEASEGASVQQAPPRLTPGQAWRLKRLDGGGYTLTCNGLALTAAQGAGTPLTLAAPTGAAGQQWSLKPTHLLPNGTYTVVNVASGLVWQAPGGGGGNVAQAAATGAAGQKWTVINDGDSFINLTDEADGRAASILYGSSDPGGLLFENGGIGGANSFFHVVPTGRGAVSLSVLSDGLALEDPHGATATGTNLVQNVWNGSPSQTWRFTPVK